MYELANWINEGNTSRKIRIAATVYIDAVTNPAAIGGGTARQASAENRLPPGTQAMLNIFQSRDTLLADFNLNGGPISNTGLLDFQQIDLDSVSDQHTHRSIEDVSIWTILDFIRKRIRSR